MRELLPTPRPDHVPGMDELRDRADAERRDSGRSGPWVMANMVMGLDGAYTVEGRSAGLSSEADRMFFHRLRAVSDAILVGAGTARTENYRRPSNTGEAAQWREGRGMTSAARLAMVSNSGWLPDTMAALDGTGQVPLLFHPANTRPAFDPSQVETRTCGDLGVDLAAVLDSLAEEGAQVVLSEGGPVLLGSLNQADLIDELYVTIAPVLAGGEQTGLLGGAEAELRPYRLERVLEADGSLFLNYRRDRA